MIVFGAVGLARRWWTLRSGMGYVALTVAAALLTIQLLAWHLVGWALA
jgi:hypothetical protein